MKIQSLTILLCLLFSCQKQAKNTQVVEAGEPEVSMSDNESIEVEGIVYFSTDYGQSWANHSTDIAKEAFLTDIASTENELAIATKQHGIYQYDFASKQWHLIPSQPTTSRDIDALWLVGKKMLAGTQGDGVFLSNDSGATWKSANDGLEDLTIRKMVDTGDKIYIGTNAGLYSSDQDNIHWKKEYGYDGLQVNGITFFDHQILIGTNKGAFKATIGQSNWQPIFPERSFHNISVAKGLVYGMIYNELYASNDQGTNWFNDQTGMPPYKYSFQVVEAGENVLAGQWDGIYKKEIGLNWVKWSNGLPPNIPITEMRVLNNGILVAASSAWYQMN